MECSLILYKNTKKIIKCFRCKDDLQTCLLNWWDEMGKYSEPLEGEHAVCLMKTGKTVVYCISLNRRNRESWGMVGVRGIR